MINKIKNNLTLYCYPKLFGLADNNPFGLKVDAYLRLAKIDFQLQNILDTSQAPRNQLPYIQHGKKIISDSSCIIQYLDKAFEIYMDQSLSYQQKDLAFLVDSLLSNNLYWVMSYSRWQDERYYPDFKKAFLASVPSLNEAELDKFREYNINKYAIQGIGRYAVEDAYKNGIDSLKTISNILGEKKYLFGDKPHIIDASCYGFLANIFYFEIDTELKRYLSGSNLTAYIQRIRRLLAY